MELGGRAYDRCFVIAEAGTGYADKNPASRYIKALAFAYAAAAAGADAVKYQMFLPDEELFCPLEGDDERWKRWKNTHLAFDEWWSLKFNIEQYDMKFLASAFQRTAVEWLNELKVDAYKVASRAAKAFPYDLAPGPFFISMGMAPAPARKTVASDIYYLDCCSKYPCSLAEAWYDPETWDGLSDHSGTIWPGLDAMAHGAEILEVHFAVPGMDPGPDAPVCLSLDQLKLLCEARDGFAQMRSGR